jgi:uncharacterized protein (TIGR02186 family)
MLRLLVALWLVASPAAAQETVVAGISTDNIAITADFTGSEVLVFGAIRRDAPIPVDAGALDVVISLSGPDQNVIVRRKERRFGIWSNESGLRIRDVPSYYAVATTRPLDDILSQTERLRYQIGFDQALRLYSGHDTLADTSDFVEAALRLRTRDRLYARLEGGVRLAEQTLFQTRFQLPTNLVEGTYVAQYFLVREREVVAHGRTEITVQKAGIERWLYNLAHQQPLRYGLLSVAIALAAGWLAATAFRLAKR